MCKKYNRIVAIDTENMHHDNSIEFISILDENDLLILMQSEESFKMKIEDINIIRTWKCDIEVVKVKNGTENAMDFGLIAAIAYRFGTLMDSKFYIISNDNGFRPIITIWRARGIDIKLFGSLECLAYDNISNFVLQGDKLNQVLTDIRKTNQNENDIEDILEYKNFNSEKLKDIMVVQSKIREGKIVDIITFNKNFKGAEVKLRDIIKKNQDKYLIEIETLWDTFKHVDIT